MQHVFIDVSQNNMWILSRVERSHTKLENFNSRDTENSYLVTLGHSTEESKFHEIGQAKHSLKNSGIDKNIYRENSSFFVWC